MFSDCPYIVVKKGVSYIHMNNNSYKSSDDTIKTATELSNELDIPLIEIEPFILATKDGHYPCSISGLYKWIIDQTSGKVFSDLERNSISWILLLRVANDTDHHHLLSGIELGIIKLFVDHELSKVCRD